MAPANRVPFQLVLHFLCHARLFAYLGEPRYLLVATQPFLRNYVDHPESCNHTQISGSIKFHTQLQLCHKLQTMRRI